MQEFRKKASQVAEDRQAARGEWENKAEGGSEAAGDQLSHENQDIQNYNYDEYDSYSPWG